MVVGAHPNTPYGCTCGGIKGFDRAIKSPDLYYSVPLKELRSEKSSWRRGDKRYGDCAAQCSTNRNLDSIY